MLSLRSIPLFLCSVVAAASTVGCTTISMAAGGGGQVEALHGPPADPPPVTPLPVAAGSPNSWETSVSSLGGEDLAGPCHYVLYLPDPSATLRGVLVIFDRSDSRDLFTDTDVRALAGGLDLGLLFAQQCDAASFGDIQQSAFAGPGRALFTALDQLAPLSSHAELAHANVLLFGFSAAGVLAATMANYQPDRVIGVIAYDGASAPEQLNTVVPTAAALEVPFLVLSNDRDTSAGTERDQLFFLQGAQRRAPWAWGVQPGVGHCCAVTTKPVILPWISAAVTERLGRAGTLDPIVEAMGVFDNYTCTPNSMGGAGYQNCTMTAASLIPAGGSITNAQGWLPDAASAAAWMKWVGQ